MDSLLSLSPCSSGRTLVDLAHADYGVIELSAAPAPALKILLPNLVDHVSISISQIDAFLRQHSSSAEPSITHLLIYLFTKKVHPEIQTISSVKLLHVGKSYWVGKQLDLTVKTPLIRDVVDAFPTFQLFIAPPFQAAPFSMSVERMISLCSSVPAETPPATYAEAMVRRFRRRRSLRKSSVDSDAGATRFLSRGSATDTEEGSASVTTLKFRLRKLLRKTRDLAISSPPQYDICL